MVDRVKIKAVGNAKDANDFLEQLGKSRRTDADALQSYRQKARRAHGKAGESLVKARLIAMGYNMVETVHTPWGLIRRGGRIVGAYPVEKVSGDFRAITDEGKSVLVEVKSREEGNLPWSAFEAHQREALTLHNSCNGITYIAWVRGEEIQMWRWPVDDFAEGRSLKW